MVGELNIVSMAPFGVLLYLSFFTLPALYVRSRWVHKIFIRDPGTLFLGLDIDL